LGQQKVVEYFEKLEKAHQEDLRDNKLQNSSDLKLRAINSYKLLNDQNKILISIDWTKKNRWGRGRSVWEKTSGVEVNIDGSEYDDGVIGYEESLILSNENNQEENGDSPGGEGVMKYLAEGLGHSKKWKSEILQTPVPKKEDGIDILGRLSGSEYWQSMNRGSKHSSEMPKIELFGTAKVAISESGYHDSKLCEKIDWFAKMKKNKLFWIELLRNEKKRMKKDQKTMSKGVVAMDLSFESVKMPDQLKDLVKECLTSVDNYKVVYRSIFTMFKDGSLGNFFADFLETIVRVLENTESIHQVHNQYLAVFLLRNCNLLYMKVFSEERKRQWFANFVMHRCYEHIIKITYIHVFELLEWEAKLKLKSLDEEFYSKKLLETLALLICESKH
jgi:hypothetical protein